MVSSRSFKKITLTMNDNLVSWDQFIKASYRGTAYHYSAWLRPLSDGMGQNILIHTVSEGDIIKAGAVVSCASKLGICVGRKPWATSYTGPVLADDADENVKKSLLKSLQKTYQHVRIVASPTPNNNMQSLTPWESKTSTTALLDISDTDSLWSSFDRHARQRVRKAESIGIRMEEVDHGKDFYALYRLTYERQDLPMPLSEKQICTTLEMARKGGILRFFSAYTEDASPAASLVVLHDTKRAYFALAGSHPKYRKTDAVSLLWWRVMQEYSKTHKEIDLVGMDIPSIARFKRSFSPTIVSFNDINAYSSPFSRMLLQSGERVKSILKGTS